MIKIYNYFINMSSITDNKVECFVCVSEYSKSYIKKCPFCNFECCSPCLKKYINTTLNIEKKCMNCNKKLTRSNLVLLLGKSYTDNLYKTHIKEILFKEEKMLIPRSLPELERRKNIIEQKNKISKMDLSLKKNIKEGNIIRNSLEYFQEYHLIAAQREYYFHLNNVSNPNNKANIKNTNLYKYPCQNDNCNGFVDNSWKCSICDMVTCKHCHLIVNENHECKKDDIDTAELIKKDSKPCPKCNMYIIKSSGCDQMWCVSCHTTFDWKTLKIKTSGVLHNPEYFRYMRENGIVIPRNPNDNPCVNQFEKAYSILTKINRKNVEILNNIKKNSIIISQGRIPLIEKYISYNINSNTLKLTQIAKLSEDYATKKLKEAEEKINNLDLNYYTNIKNNLEPLFTFYRDINHIDGIVIPDARRNIREDEIWKDKQRLLYLEKQISEKEYKNILIKKLKTMEYNEEIIGFFETISEVCKIYFINKMKTIHNEIEIAEREKEYIKLSNCNNLSRLKEFVKDLKDNHETIKKLYGYTRLTYLPKIFYK